MKDPKALVPVPLHKLMTQAVTYGLTGGFFSPSMPLQPQHQETVGRAMDYPAGYNIATKPRRDSGVDFESLRNFAKFYDLLRILIEKRKDQIANFDWSIVPTDEAVAEADRDPELIAKLNARASAAQKFLKFPDGRQKWNTWIRAIVEDMLVLDAIAIWPVYQGPALKRLDLIDPATIKLVIDDSGRRPEPPFPAYQQVLHGVPTADFMKHDLAYYISNPASNRIYGLSKVEQIIVTIQIGLRREFSQLQFFTEGNVPAALAGVPENWTATQIATLQAAFDSMISGDMAARRKIWFVPGETSKNIKEFKSEEATLKAAFDEWIIRIMCFTFGISPTPFVNGVNRATAFSATEEARDEGLGPQLTFLKGMVDGIIAQCLKLDGIEFKWSMEAENDPTAQSGIDDTMLRNGSRSIDELRQRDGLDPLGMGPAVYLPAGPMLVKDIVSGKVAAMQAAAAAGPGGAGGGKGGPPAPPQTKPKASIAATSSSPKGSASPPGAGTAAANNKDIEAPLAVHKNDTEVSARSARPFHKSGKSFRYPADTIRKPASEAAHSRLVKASKGSRN